MSGLKVDINSINNNVIPTLNKSITKLENAAETLRSVSYVEYYTFDSRSKVQNALPRDIRSIKWNISGVKKWLEDASDRFKQAEENTKKLVESLQVPTGNIGTITNKSNSEVENLPEEINSNNYNVFASKESYDEFLKNFCNPDTLSIYKVNYEGNLKLTQTEILEENRKGTKVKDDPETQEGLELLNNLLNAQKADLKDNAEEFSNEIISISNNLNPQIKNYIYTEYRDGTYYESVENVSNLISEFQRIKELMEGMDYNELKDQDYYSGVNGGGFGLYYTKEDWEAVKQYLKDKNMSWSELIDEYEQIINSLQEYRDELLSAQNAIYQLERYIELYPYTKIMQNVDFEEYLERDYSDDEIMGTENFFDKALYFLAYGLKEPEKIKNFKELTQEEKAIYFYVKEKYSEEEAEEYCKSLEDTINQRKGMKDALKYIESLDVSELDTEAGVEGFLKAIGMEENINQKSNSCKTVMMGLYDGIWSFNEGLYNLFPGNGEITSELQYKQAFIISMLTQDINLDEIEKTYGKDSEEYKAYEKLYKMQDVMKETLGIEYNVAVSIGSEAIPIAVSQIPYVGQYLSLTLSGLSDAGNAKATAYQSGVTGWNAYLYAGIRGVSSAVITKSFGAVPGVSDNASTTFKGIIKGATEARNFCCCTIKD